MEINTMSNFSDEYSSSIVNNSNIHLTTVNEWFLQWIGIIDGIRKPKTVSNYTNYYNKNIKPVIGNMPISKVKPMHCSKVLQNMSSTYKESSIKQTRVAMSCMFQYAVDNDVIFKNPVGKSVVIPTNINLTNENTRHLLLNQEEINSFLTTAKETPYYLPCSLVLETGLRAGELIGLTWDEIDFENNYIHVRHTMQYDKNRGWYFSTPKSKQSSRDIYMTVKCRQILIKAKEAYIIRKKDRDSIFNNLVFTSIHGTPIRNNSYDIGINSICKKAGINRFSIHSLRHTFASRCIMAGISPKVLQTIMGHSDISTTLNIYVHIDNSINEAEMKKLSLI